jgi:hypothetical protein
MDFYTRYPDKPDSAYCKSCHTIKPIADFTRRATLSESRNWTKKPNLKRAITYEGKLCNGCQKRRKPSDLSPEELRKAPRQRGCQSPKNPSQGRSTLCQGQSQPQTKADQSPSRTLRGAVQAMLKDTAEQLRKTSEHLRYARRSSKPDDYIET